MHSSPFDVHWLPANLASMGLHGLHFTVCQDNSRLSCAECLKQACRRKSPFDPQATYMLSRHSNQEGVFPCVHDVRVLHEPLRGSSMTEEPEQAQRFMLLCLPRAAPQLTLRAMEQVQTS